MAEYLLDTSVLVRCLRGVDTSIELTRTLSEQGDLYVSALSLLEVLAEANAREEKRTLEFLAPFLHVALNDEIAERAARLARPGAPNQAVLNLPEAIVAATALRHGLTLVTYSGGAFGNVPELKLLPGV